MRPGESREFVILAWAVGVVAAAQRRMAGVPETPMHVPPIQRAAGSMTSGPTGLKIDWFETQPSPGFDRLAPGEPMARIKNAVPSKEQKSCCSDDTKSAAARSFPFAFSLSFRHRSRAQLATAPMWVFARWVSFPI
jgi:hypothetical protein